MSESNKKKRLVVIGLVAAVSVGTVVAALIVKGEGRTGRSAAANDPYADMAMPEYQAALKAELLDPKGTPAQKIAALVRLAKTVDPFAKQEAVAWAADPDSRKREAAAHALGYFDDAEANSGLVKLFGDANSTVRMQAIRAFGYRDSTERPSLLRKLADDKTLSDYERITILTALHRTSKDEAVKKEAFEKLLSLYREGKDATRVSALTNLVAIDGRHVGLRGELEKIVREEKDAALLAIAWQELQVQAPGELRPHAKRLLGLPSNELRRTVLSSFVRVCPDDRYTLIEHIIRTDRDRNMVAHAVATLKALNDMGARELATRLSAVGNKLDEETLKGLAPLARGDDPSLESAGSPCEK